MVGEWLQIKGDPSVREFLFKQTRQTSLFDKNIDRLHQIIVTLSSVKGVFHVKAHYSSTQLTCWFYDDPYNYRVYVKDEVFDLDFQGSLPDVLYEGRRPRIKLAEVNKILDEFKRLRLSDEQIYLRSASFNRLNGMIGMNFSCDGSHYIGHEEFFNHEYEFGLEGALSKGD